ncbi:MAG: Ig-like domain-containing protein, partial [Ardenticatenaceae bacterium]
MPARANKAAIVILVLALVGLVVGALWFVRQGVQPEEVQRNPAVVEALPLPAEPVSRATTVEFLFDQAMDQGSVEQALSVSPPFAYGLEWNNEGGGDHVIVRPLEALDWDTTYHVTVGTEAQNEAGRPLDSAAEVAFTTSREARVSEVYPAVDSSGVDVDQPITVRFDRPMVEVASLESEEQAELPQPILISPPAEGTGLWLAPDLFGFYPSGGLLRGTAYEVTVSPLVAPGLELPESYEWSFLTEGPRVEASFPFGGAREVASAAAIRLLFVQPMDRASVEENFRLSAQGSDVPVAGEFRWEDDATLVFVPREPLDVASDYEIALGEEARADGGSRGLASPYRALFTTIDYLGVESVQPAPGSIEVSTVPTDTAITVQFNHPVVPLVGLAAAEALPNPLQIEPTVEGVGEWVTTSLFQFRPSER